MITDRVVCGFFTPDYQRWADTLRASLDQHGEPHDIVQTIKQPGGWEANTMAKGQHILAAMDRHPDKAIIWLDVDCTVHGSLAPLAELGGDVAFRMHSKFRRWRKGTRFRTQSGTMVFKPNDRARRYVELWKQASEAAPYGEIDQSSQVVAMSKAHGTSFVTLPLIYCANPDEAIPGTVIQHVSARAILNLPRTVGAVRYVGRCLGWRTVESKAA